jgi:hypothetical protein|tara:strand:- start:4359 stop:4769 length:411 start_codon:yes stop_codon:yes gene_type:complete
MKVQEVEIDNLTTLANFLIKNDGNQIVVESSDFKNTNDLFFFCVEITTKILAIKFGNLDGIVNIDQLSSSDFNSIKEILLNAAIDLQLNIEDIDFPNDIAHIEYAVDTNFVLRDYKMIIKKNNKKFIIDFDIIIVN